MMRIIAVGVALLALFAGGSTLYLLIVTAVLNLSITPILFTAGICALICIWLGVAIILFEVRNPDA